ncbi:hypothetical protein OSB04_027936 [Centaurea solstitialis]|uniref:Uncharacterized protein n=1 Tax=Centaurea solstitialis TaxID=347529 RepID=A0AA38W799_9ASTR|nr:hypothetical protein OSB04_027936 [Centaurea solstitialis]
MSKSVIPFYTPEESLRLINCKWKLTGQNFPVWKMHLDNVLRAQDESDVMSILIFSTSPEFTGDLRVKSCHQVVKDMENQLGLYKHTGKLLIMQEIFSLKLKKGQSVKDHLIEMKRLFKCLSRLGYKMAQEELVYLMWFSLTKEIQDTASAYMKEPKKDVDKVHEDILASLEPVPEPANLMDTDVIDELGDLSCPECGSEDICEHSMNIDQIEIGLPDAPCIFMIDCLITSYESWNLRVGEGTPLIAEAVGSYSLSLPSGLVLELDNSTPVNGLYTVNLQDNSSEIYHISKRSKDIEDQTYLRHCRLGHINKKRVELLLKGGFLGTFDYKPFDNCESCLSGKMTKQPFNKENERATDLLEIIHTDVCGPFSHVARGGYRYFITFTDDSSRYGYVYLMRHKSESFERFREFQNEVQNQLGRRIKFLRSDHRGEYLSDEFDNHLMECGIVSQLTPPYTPQMNGVSERRNRTLLDMVRTMMCHSTLPMSFWGHALETAAHILNKSANKLWERRKDVDLQVVDEENTTPIVEPEIQHENVEPQSELIEEVQTQDLRRSSRVRQEPDRYLGFLVSQDSGDLNEPTSYGEAVSGNESEQWQEAMKAEMQSMYDNQVWELTDLPQHCRAVGRKWVFKKKTDMDGNVHTFKARLVAKGFTQTHGIDYDETFSPVAMLKSIRILMAISAYFNYEIWQMDVKTAFLNGKLTEDVYMEQPEGFEDPKNPNKVCKLLKSIYGLKQASRSWNLHFDERIKEFGFAKSEFEPCVYTKFSGSIVTFLVLYVDDILPIGNDVPTLQSVKGWLSKCFQMKDLGEAAYILGIKIYRNRSKRLIGLSQSTYIDKILKKFRMDESKKGFIPMQHGIVLSKTQCPVSSQDQDKMKSVPYASAIGSIMYAMLCTRPDVAYSVSVTSRYQQNPGEPYWVAVKNILKYLRRTKDMFLVFGGSEDEISVKGYSDANSTIEAEYIAASDAQKEAVWLKNFLSDLRVVASVSRPIDIFCDNSGAVAQAKEPREHHKSRHVLRKYHLIREIIGRGDVRICKIPTEENVADPLTKPLARVKHETHANSFGMQYLDATDSRPVSVAVYPLLAIRLIIHKVPSIPATKVAVPACGGADGVRPSVGSLMVIADCKSNSTTAASFFSPDQRSPLSSPTVVMPVQPSSDATPPAVLLVQSGAVGGARVSQLPSPGPAVAEPFVETSAGTTGVIGDVGSFQQLLRDISGAHGHQQKSSMLSPAAAMFSSFLASPVGMGSSRGVLPMASVSSSEVVTLSSQGGSLKLSADKLDEVGLDMGNDPTMSEEKVPNAGRFVDSKGKVHLHADEMDVAHKPVSFADLLKKSANLVCGKGKLTYYPPVVTELGTRRAIIPDELVQKQATEWTLTLAGYFIGKRPAFPFVQYPARRLNFVFENGPWLFNGMPIFIQRWQPGLCFDKPELKTVPLWVNIYGLPLDVWDYEIISRIASVVGEPVSVDRHTDEMCVTKSGRANFARVLVNVSADYELPSNIDVIILGKLRKFKTEFLWKPKRCSHCKVFGHDFDMCVVRPRIADEVKKVNPDVEDDPQWSLDKKEVDDFIEKRGVGLEPVIINSGVAQIWIISLGGGKRVFGKEPDGTSTGFTLPDRQIISDDDGSDSDSQDDAELVEDAPSDATLGTPVSKPMARLILGKIRAKACPFVNVYKLSFVNVHMLRIEGFRTQPNVEICPPCPRCGSSNTKFCYYNNYSLTQPRYFCKGCRRYWTKGGSLRNIPVGGGCRKTRRARSVRISDTITSQNFLARGGGGTTGGYGGRGNVEARSGGGGSMGQQPSNIDLQQVYANFLNQRPQDGDGNEQARDHVVLHSEVDPMLSFGFPTIPNMEMEFGATNYGSNLEGFLNEGHGMQFCGYNSIFGNNEEEQEKHDFFGTSGISNCGLPPLPGEELGWSESNIGFSENVLNPRIDQPEGQIAGECSVKMFDLPDNSDTIFRP